MHAAIWLIWRKLIATAAIPRQVCLVSFLCIENPAESAPEPPDISTLNVQDDDACEGNEEDDHNGESNDDLHAENFKVKGSFFQEHYQQALLKCDNAKRQNQTITARVEFEPDNIQDKNAIKFEVYFNSEWHIIGYCAVKKIPKLKTAMNASEIKTVSLLYVKREWIMWQSKFSFYYTTQALRGPITKINQSKCSIAGPIFSKYWTGHCPE